MSTFYVSLPKFKYSLETGSSAAKHPANLFSIPGGQLWVPQQSCAESFLHHTTKMNPAGLLTSSMPKWRRICMQPPPLHLHPAPGALGRIVGTGPLPVRSAWPCTHAPAWAPGTPREGTHGGCWSQLASWCWAGADSPHRARAGSLQKLGNVPAQGSAAHPLSTYCCADFLQQPPDSRAQCKKLSDHCFLADEAMDNFLNTQVIIQAVLLHMSFKNFDDTQMMCKRNYEQHHTEFVCLLISA